MTGVQTCALPIWSRGAYYFYDKNSSELTKLAELSPWLNENDLCEMKPISYTSRDGLTIQGYLTLPKGYNPKNLPVVINPHGGPWARDYWGFNPEVQFLANNGYAVLQMNFRGSTGFGKAFWEASFKQWGQTMQDDISDGVKWLYRTRNRRPGTGRHIWRKLWWIRHPGRTGVHARTVCGRGRLDRKSVV